MSKDKERGKQRGMDGGREMERCEREIRERDRRCEKGTTRLQPKKTYDFVAIFIDSQYLVRYTRVTKAVGDRREVASRAQPCTKHTRSIVHVHGTGKTLNHALIR